MTPAGVLQVAPWAQVSFMPAGGASSSPGDSASLKYSPTSRLEGRLPSLLQEGHASPEAFSDVGAAHGDACGCGLRLPSLERQATPNLEGRATPVSGYRGDGLCAWCKTKLTSEQISHGSRYCSKRCRQTAWRSRHDRLGSVADAGGCDPAVRLRLAYADPPYPGMSRKYYGDESTFRGEVNHAVLIRHLSGFDGWALSTCEKSLQYVLSLCPDGVRVGSWAKPENVANDPRRHALWEPVIYLPARRLAPGVRDALTAAPAKGGDSSLPGRKPIAFVRWMLSLIGARPGDEFWDLYPGSEVAGRVWRQISPGSVTRPASDLESATSPSGDSGRAA